MLTTFWKPGTPLAIESTGLEPGLQHRRTDHFESLINWEVDVAAATAIVVSVRVTQYTHALQYCYGDAGSSFTMKASLFVLCDLLITSVIAGIMSLESNVHRNKHSIVQDVHSLWSTTAVRTCLCCVILHPT